ncbi:MAG: short-chain dehydrogenase/reductase [Acidimicrobiales bacterium]|nr:short-chain dehydrogenase/reductase [Acidimicrobiales bacterium]
MIVLVTGSSSGFGLLIAERFAAAGDTVVATMRTPTKAPADLAACDVIALDVTDQRSVDAAVAHTLETHGRIDVLVNNAGGGLHGAVEDVSDAAAKALFETNFFGALRMVRAVLPSMRAAGSGVVVNVSSLAGRITPPFEGIYAASKYALEAATEALHYELGPFGVRVHLVEPGRFPTQFAAARVDAPTDAYADLSARWETVFDAMGADGEPGDPRRVADAVYDVAHDPTAPLRRLVGDDAELLGALRQQLDDLEFEQTVRGTLDFWDGARPPVI